MPENNANKCMEFLKPVAVGLCALMSAATMYLQRTESSSVDSRLTALEVQTETLQPWRARVDGEMDNFRSVLSDIRSDVSFIRGKMEAGK